MVSLFLVKLDSPAKLCKQKCIDSEKIFHQQLFLDCFLSFHKVLCRVDQDIRTLMIKS